MEELEDLFKNPILKRLHEDDKSIIEINSIFHNTNKIQIMKFIIEKLKKILHSKV